MSSRPLQASLQLLRALRKRRQAASRKSVLGLLVAALVLGVLTQPSSDALTHTRGWGGWPIEAAFGGIVLATALVTFLIQELLYRTHDAHALRNLPVNPMAFGLDRLAVALQTSLSSSLVVGAFVAPSLVGAPAPLVFSTLLFLALGTLLVPGVSLATIIISGDQASRAAAATPGRSASTSAALHMAPGVAFGACVALLLLLKLGVEEPLRLTTSADGNVTLGMALQSLLGARSAWLATGIPLVAALAGGWMGIQTIRRRHDDIQAFFVDAESHRPIPGHIPPSRTIRRSAWLENKVGLQVSLLAWKDGVQLARGYPFLRIGSVLVAVASLFVGWVAAGQISAALVGIGMAAWLVFGVDPLRRLQGLTGEEPYGQADLLAAPLPRLHAWRIAGSRELVWHAIPLLAAGLGLGVEGALLVAALVISGFGAALIALWTGGPGRIRQLVIFAVAMALVAFPVAVKLSLAAAVLLFLGALVLSFQRLSTALQKA